MTASACLAALPLALHVSEPRALWLLALALPLLAAHLVRRRRQRIVVAHVGLLLDARGQVRGGGLGRRLRDLAPLACRLLALGALTCVVAGLAPRPPAPPVPLALVLDVDATGQAREADGRSRLEHLLALAAALVRAHAEGPVSVVFAQAAPRVFAQDESDREALARRLADPALAPSLPRGERADLQTALASARRLVPAPGWVRVLTARAWPADAALEQALLLGAGGADDDQGLVDVGVRPVAGSERMRVAVVVKSFGPRPTTRGVVLRLQGSPDERRELTLAPGAEVEAAFEVLVPRGGAPVEVALEGADAFERNDRLDLVVAGPLRPSVLAVHAGAGLRPYTAAALDALGERIDRAASGGVAVADLGTARSRDVTLVDGAALPPGALTPGAWLFLAPLSGALPFEVGPLVERPLVWRARAGHPLVLDLDLADAWVSRATPLRPADDVLGLAFAAADEPVLAEGERGGVRWVALALEPEASDLPVRAAFPLLVRNAIMRLARAQAEALPPFVRAGDALRSRVPLPGGPLAELRWSGGAPTLARVDPGTGPRAPFAHLGLVEVRTGSAEAPGYVGRTAVVDLDRGQSIVPARPAAPWPSARATPPDPARRWALLLGLLAAALLVLDLLLTRASGGRGASASAPS